MSEYFVTEVRHGKELGEVDVVPADAPLSKYKNLFSNEELNNFRAMGVLVPMSDETSNLVDDVARKDAEIADLRAQLEAMQQPANQNAPAGTGSGNNSDGTENEQKTGQGDGKNTDSKSLSL